MDILKNRIFWNLSIVLAGLFFITRTIQSLIVGGRWDLNEQIAFAYRISDGVIAYCNGIDDLFFPSSPYFPGVGFLSYFYKILGFENIFLNNQLMLLTAVFIGVLFFILIYKLTIRLYPEISPNIVIVFLTLFFVTHFRAYIGYMIEFKPDTILLALGLFSLFIIENGKKPTFLKLCLVGLLLLLSIPFKQSFFLIFLLVYILILFNEFLTKKEKVITIFIYSTLGLISLYFMFKIDNLYLFTVETMSKHPILDIKSILIFIYQTVKENIIFLLAMLYFLILKYKDFKLSTLESKYFLFALVWLGFSILSMIKSGGNTGNSEVGLVVFLPFAIYSLNEFFKEFYRIKNFGILVLIPLVALILLFSLNFIKKSLEYKNKIQNYLISAEYLSKNYKNANTFIDGNTFVIAKMAHMNILTESETIGNFNGILNYDMQRVKDAFNTQVYDIVFVENLFDYYKDKDISKIFLEKYELYKDENLPKYLENKLYIKKELN